jgi:hypothetical protein
MPQLVASVVTRTCRYRSKALIPLCQKVSLVTQLKTLLSVVSRMVVCRSSSFELRGLGARCSNTPKRPQRKSHDADRLEHLKAEINTLERETADVVEKGTFLTLV